MKNIIIMYGWLTSLISQVPTWGCHAYHAHTCILYHIAYTHILHIYTYKTIRYVLYIIIKLYILQVGVMLYTTHYVYCVNYIAGYRVVYITVGIKRTISQLLHIWIYWGIYYMVHIR